VGPSLNVEINRRFFGWKTYGSFLIFVYFGVFVQRVGFAIKALCRSGDHIVLGMYGMQQILTSPDNVIFVYFGIFVQRVGFAIKALFVDRGITLF